MAISDGEDQVFRPPKNAFEQKEFDCISGVSTFKQEKFDEVRGVLGDSRKRYTRGNWFN